MSFRGNLALLLLITCISRLVVPAESGKGAGRKGKRRESRGDSNAAVIKGKFTTKDEAQCSWVARGEDKYALTVTCKPGKGDGFTCKYTAKPAACPAFVTNPENYWRQMSRSMKKQKKLCSDPRAVLRVGACKNAPRDAHFRLSETAHEKTPKIEETRVIDPEIPRSETMPDTPRTCAKHSDHSKIAIEKCGDSWASLCTFIFTLVQNGDC